MKESPHMCHLVMSSPLNLKRFGKNSTPLLLCILITSISGCALVKSNDIKTQQIPAFVQIPLHAGWHEGQQVFYITTDVSDQQAAKDNQANFAPRLKEALSDSLPILGHRTTLEHIYHITNYQQDSVLPSAPTPVGHTSTDVAYSPLWQVYEVTWQTNSTPQLLTSEEAILDVVEKGQATITKTRIVVNCPVVYSQQGGLVEGMKLIE